jgi:hypothetical protein
MLKAHRDNSFVLNRCRVHDRYTTHLVIALVKCAAKRACLQLNQNLLAGRDCPTSFDFKWKSTWSVEFDSFSFLIFPAHQPRLLLLYPFQQFRRRFVVGVLRHKLAHAIGLRPRQGDSTSHNGVAHVAFERMKSDLSWSHTPCNPVLAQSFRRRICMISPQPALNYRTQHRRV